jgi:translation elongation factor EF-1beta
MALLGVACQRKESVLDAIHQTVDAARSRQKVQIDITTEKPDASPAELALQQRIEKEIEKAHKAHVVDDGSGPGYVRINVEVDDKTTGVDNIREILRADGVLNRSTVKILQ